MLSLVASVVSAAVVHPVFVVGPPILFVRALISVTTPKLPCTVACEPAAAIVKPRFTGASPPDAGPPIPVVAAFTTCLSNDVYLALAPSSFLFGGWNPFV